VKPVTKRWIRRCILGLALGLFIPIAMSWTLPRLGRPKQDLDPQVDRWPYPVPDHWPPLEWGGGVRRYRRFGVLITTCYVSQGTAHSPGPFYFQHVVSVGWPWKCLRYEIRSGSQDTTVPVSERLLGALAVSGDTQRGPFLPYWVEWCGLGANTLVCGPLVMSILVGRQSVARCLRRRRGLCARCGYRLLGLPEGRCCPECGCTEDDL
jgi:hypothetical protein